MSRTTRSPMHRFFLFNMFAGLLALSATLLLAMGGESIQSLQPWQAGDDAARLALAALLYTVFAWYADQYFRPCPRRDL
jgi:membrane protein DedA with SNARE-associated domain